MIYLSAIYNSKWIIGIPQLTSGEELLAALKKVQPDIKTIIFSIEDKSFRIKSLFNNLGINAFVCKGRNSIPELKKAIQRVFENNTKILSPALSHALRDKSPIEIETYAILLLKSMCKGLTLDETVVLAGFCIPTNHSSSPLFYIIVH
jgi:DNA-binding NarL/FixJ family response regulator